MESSLGCSRGQRVVGPAHRLGQWQRVESQRARHLNGYHLTAGVRMRCYEMMTTAARHPRIEGGLLVVLEWPRMRDHGAEKRRPLVVRRKGNSSARAIGTGHTFRPRSSARGLAGMKTAVSVSRASADTATGRTPTLTASAMGAERRPTRGRRLWRACSYFWTPVVRAPF